MALTLKLKYEQSNDATIVRLTDDTGLVSANNAEGWGTINVVDIVDSTSEGYHLYLDITIKDSDQVSTVYDRIYLKDTFPDEFLKSTGMVFDLTPAHMEISGSAGDDVTHVDGIWTIKYVLENYSLLASSIIASTTYSILIDGTVAKKVANSFLSSVFDIERGINEANWGNIKRSLIKNAYLVGVRCNPSIAQQSKKMNILKTLQNYTIND